MTDSGQSKIDDSIRVVEGSGMWGARLFRFDRIDSTNRWTLEHLDSLGHGDVICALRQSRGTGRLSREWISPEDRGLALTVVIDLEACPDLMPTLGQSAAVALRESLETFGIDASLKWPNDVLVNGKKIAGILAQAGSIHHRVALGIGLNVNVTREDLNAARLLPHATSLRIEKGRRFNMDRVRIRVLDDLAVTLESVAGRGFEYVRRCWIEHDGLTGSHIAVTEPNGTVCGKYQGIDRHGRLKVLDRAGNTRLFWSADVEKVRAEA